MMSTAPTAKIRTSFTPTERALIAAYLRYPDAAPAEIDAIDITQPVDPDEWDENVRGIAPFESEAGGTDLMLENAVARICLEPVAHRLPQWAALSDRGNTFGRGRRKRCGLRRTRAHRPKPLLMLNWGDSGPGFSWPETYYVSRLPGYGICIVTASADSPDTYGYCDVAIGWYVGRPSELEKIGEVIRRWWASLRDAGQARWSYLFDAVAVDEATVERWADDVWPADDEAGDEPDDE